VPCRLRCAPAADPEGDGDAEQAEQALAAELDQLYDEATRAASEPSARASHQRWRTLSAKAARAELCALVRTIAAEVRGGAAPDGIDPSRGFAEQGFDSLMAVRLGARLGRAFGVALSATLMFDYPTVDLLVEHLATDVLDLPGRAERREARSDAVNEPIAIIGAACRLSAGIEDLASFWRLLAEGSVVATEVPADRWDVAAWYDADPETLGRTYTKRGGFLRDVQSFDAAFFRISPREAASMDPQQRLLLEGASVATLTDLVLAQRDEGRATRPDGRAHLGSGGRSQPLDPRLEAARASLPAAALLPLRGRRPPGVLAMA
jgi:acyl carrier protein